MTDAEYLNAVPIVKYGMYASMLARIYMLPHAMVNESQEATVHAAQLKLYGQVEEGLRDALSGRGIAREVAADFAVKFCSRILADIRGIEAEEV